MDGERFDAIATRLAAGASRRGALRLLAGALGGGLAAAARPGRTLAYPGTCRRFVLSGGPSPDDPIPVIADLTVRLNGGPIFVDGDGRGSDLAPIRFAARAGDRLRIVARSGAVELGGCRYLGQLYLHCRTGGTARTLSDGVPYDCNGEPSGVFFDQRYVI